MVQSQTLQWLTQDWAANRDTHKMRLLLVAFRGAQLVRERCGRTSIPNFLASTVYRFLAEALFSVEIPVSVKAGPGLCIYHGFGLVVHSRAILGRGVTLRHGVTIGNLGYGGAPTIGDGVSVGVGASILGAIHVGDNVRIGPHALVMQDVAAGRVVLARAAQEKGVSGG